MGWSVNGVEIQGYGQGPDYRRRGAGGLPILLRDDNPDGLFVGRLQHIAEVAWAYLEGVWKNPDGSWVNGGAGPMVFLTPHRPPYISPEWYVTAMVGVGHLKWAGGGSRATINDLNVRPPNNVAWNCKPLTILVGGGGDVDIGFSLAHEFGHACGLEHEAGTVMNNTGNLNVGWTERQKAVVRAAVARLRAETNQYTFP